MKLSKHFLALVLGVSSLAFHGKAQSDVERTLLQEVNTIAGSVFAQDSVDRDTRELRRMLLGMAGGVLPTNTLFGSPVWAQRPPLANLGFGGFSLDPSSYDLDLANTLIANFSNAYCTPIRFNPATIRGSTFVGPKLAIRIVRPQCFLGEKIDFNKTITADENADTLTIEETGDVTKNLTCFGPSITVIKTPPTYYSKTYTGACLTTASCNIQANFGLEYFRYLYTGASNISIPLDRLNDPLYVAQALGYSPSSLVSLAASKSQALGDLAGKVGSALHFGSTTQPNAQTENAGPVAGSVGPTAAAAAAPTTWAGWSFQMKQ